MAEPEITFGIRRVRTSAITQSATKMTTVATVMDCINSLHFSVQRRPDVRGAAVRPPLSRFHPTYVGPGSGRGAVDHFLGLAPERADVLGDHDRRRRGDRADHRESDAVLGQVLASVIGGQSHNKRCHVLLLSGVPPRVRCWASLRSGPFEPTRRKSTPNIPAT